MNQEDLLTDQEAFDHVAKALIKQGCQSSDGMICQYISSNGDKCAAGHLMIESLYDPTWESFGVDKLPLNVFKTDNLTLLCRLQNSHDFYLGERRSDGSPAHLKKWKDSMKKVAAIFFLNSNVLENA